jgi:hypothetical protein
MTTPSRRRFTWSILGDIMARSDMSMSDVSNILDNFWRPKERPVPGGYVMETPAWRRMRRGGGGEVD